MPVVQQRQSRAFKDISLSFKKHPVTNDIISLTNENAIKRSVRNLVETINEERFFNPLIGSNVKNSLNYNIIGQEANPQEITFILQPTRE